MIKKNNLTMFCLGFIFCYSYALAENSIDKKCDTDKKIGVIYLNGVRNDFKEDVVPSRERVESIVFDEKFLGGVPYKDICFNELYNQTYSILDFIETLGQKIREEKESKGEKFKWEDVTLFMATGKSSLLFPESLESQIELDKINKDATVKTFFEEAEEETLNFISTKMKDILLKDSEVPSRITNIRPSVIVSHSQGNLFANLLYNNLLNSSDFDSILLDSNLANLQVGTAASSLNIPVTDYYTSNHDLVINSLHLLPFTTLPANMTYFESPHPKDLLLGHGFREIYASLEGVATFEKEILEHGIYPSKTLVGYDGPSETVPIYRDDFSKYELYGIKHDISKNTKKMSDIFYDKLNSLAKRLVCTDETATAISLNSRGYEIRPVYDVNSYVDHNLNGIYPLDSTKRIISFEVGRRDEQGLFTTEGVDQSSFLISYFVGSESKFLGKAGDRIPENIGNYIQREDTMTYNIRFLDENLAENNCFKDTYHVSSKYIGPELIKWSNLSTVQIKDRRNYLTKNIKSFKVFDGRFKDKTGKGRYNTHYLSEIDPASLTTPLYEWDNGGVLPEGITLGMDGNTANYTFKINSTFNSVIVTEVCYEFGCRTNFIQNISKPETILGAGGGSNDGITVVNKIPVKPLADIKIETSVIGGIRDSEDPGDMIGDIGKITYLNALPPYDNVGGQKYYYFNVYAECSGKSYYNPDGATLISREHVGNSSNSTEAYYSFANDINVNFELNLKFGDEFDNDFPDVYYNRNFNMCN